MRCFIFLGLIGCLITPVQAQEYLDFYDKGSGYIGVNKDSSYYYFEKAIKSAQKDNELEVLLISLKDLMYSNGYYYDLKSYQKNLERYESVLNTDEAKRLQYYHYYLDSYQLELINYYYKLANYAKTQEAIENLEERLKQRAPNLRDVDYYEIALSTGLYQASVYKNSSKIYLALEKYDQLHSLIEQHRDSLSYAEVNSLTVSRLQSKAYTSIGNVDKALQIQRQMLEALSDQKAFTNTKLDLYLSIAQNLIATDALSDAETILRKIETPSKEKQRFFIQFLKVKSNLARKQNKEDQNSDLHKEIIQQTIAYRESSKHPDVIQAHIDFASDETFWNRPENAFKQLKIASELLPELEKTQNFQLIRLHLNVAGQYLRTYQTVLDPTPYSEEILFQTRKILTALDILQPQFESKLDKQYLIDITYPALQSAFVLMYRLYGLTGDQKYLNEAFTVSEKSKAIELRSIRQAGIAQRTLDIDPQIIETENLLTYRINSFEKQQFQSAENNLSIQDSLLKLQEAYGEFINSIKERYPDYYNLRYKNETISLSEYTDILEQGEGIVSYFQAGEMMYAISVTQDNSGLVQISYSKEIQEKIRDYYTLISKAKIKNREQIDALAKELYAHFIGNIFPNKLPPTLTIIPDGLLHYLPFEALKNGEEYIVFNSAISYEPSITSTSVISNEKEGDVDFLGFAPDFDKNNTLGLSPLSYNSEEIERAQTFFDGKLFAGDEASLVRFRESIKNNRTFSSTPIYHLATHAITNDTLPEYSYLAFSPTSDPSNYILYAKDLYTEELNGAMVVLSACETGLGTLTNGQGMQSLAQGFRYGGASSLLYSKWNVSDRYTADLMSLYYKYLDEGSSKNRALQQAKIEYLNTGDDPNLKHPFYWASFVFSGDNTALRNNNAILQWMGISGIVILMLLSGIYLKKRIT